MDEYGFKAAQAKAMVQGRGSTFDAGLANSASNRLEPSKPVMARVFDLISEVEAQAEKLFVQASSITDTLVGQAPEPACGESETVRDVSSSHLLALEDRLQRISGLLTRGMINLGRLQSQIN